MCRDTRLCIMMLQNTNNKGINGFSQIFNNRFYDGGIYVPDILPCLPKAFFKNINEMSLNDIAFVLMRSLCGDQISSEIIKQIVDTSINFDIPLQKLAANRYILELFHGPTMSYEDIGARLSASILNYAWDGKNRPRDVVVVTSSGDGGSAVAHAFQSDTNIRVCVLFPSGRLSKDQISQFAYLSNVLPIEVDGSLYDCQLTAKKLLESEYGQNVIFASENLTSLVRELPYLICYFHAYARAIAYGAEDKDIVFSMHCDNVVNISAALMVKKMGLPIKNIIFTNNINDVLVNFFKKGYVKSKRDLMSLAHVMSLENLSIARIIELYNKYVARFCNEVGGFAYRDDTDLRNAMKEIYTKYGYIIDPKSAMAARMLDVQLDENDVGISFAKFLPSKFHDMVYDVTGALIPPFPEEASGVKRHRIKTVKIPASLPALIRTLAI